MSRPLLWIVLGSTIASLSAYGQQIAFLRQIAASGGPETSSGIAADATGIYVTGSRATAPAAESPEAFLRRFDAAGSEVWTRWMGHSSDAYGGVVVTGSGLYVAGSTESGLRSPGSAEIWNGYLRKYDTAGNEVWTRQVASSSRSIAARDLAVDSTGVYLVGITIEVGALNTAPEAFIRKYDFDGAEQWSRPLSGAIPNCVAADATGVYLAGVYLPAKGFVKKYDAGGEELWTNFTGESNLLGIATDATGTYVAGISYQDGYYSRYGFVRKYDNSGTELWSRQFGRGTVLSVKVTADVDAVHVAGSTTGALPGQCSAGSYDAFVTKYDTRGAELWTRQFGGAGGDQMTEAVAAFSGVYVAGANYEGDSVNLFLAKLQDAPALVADSRPRILWECIVNAAGYDGGGVSPGEMVTIFGSGLGPSQPAAQQVTTEGGLSNSIAGTRVLFNGLPAPLLYVSERQVSAIVPYGVPCGLSGSCTVEVQVEYRGARSDAVRAPVVRARPGIFTLDGSGRGQAVAFNENGSVNSPSNAAEPGSIVVLYATGEGLTDQSNADGSILSNPLPRPRLPVAVFFFSDDGDSFRSEALYAGGVSGSVAGLLQVSVRLPNLHRNWFAHLEIGPGALRPDLGWVDLSVFPASIAVR
jgi:uncharacterized protein (TIGR03437 family)